VKCPSEAELPFYILAKVTVRFYFVSSVSDAADFGGSGITGTSAGFLGREGIKFSISCTIIAFSFNRLELIKERVSQYCEMMSSKHLRKPGMRFTNIDA
jgi:hypothetical protein